MDFSNEVLSMHTFLQLALSSLCTVCILLLSGCSFLLTTEGGDPYTPADVVSMVEKEFAALQPRLVIQSTAVEKEKPFQHNLYRLYDQTHDISFTPAQPMYGALHCHSREVSVPPMHCSIMLQPIATISMPTSSPAQLPETSV